MYDLVVMGEGAGGLRAATAAAGVGARVALIEKRRPDGAPPASGAVASKALVQAARLFRRVREAASFGIEMGTPAVDFAKVMSRVREVAGAVAARDAERISRTPNIDLFQGTAAFDSYDTVVVDGGKHVVGRRFVIATGSRPSIPNVKGLKEVGCLDSQSLWNLAKVPKSLVVIGAGPVGLELAQVFARFGTKVTVLADSSQVLPGEEAEAAELVERALTAEGVTIKTGVTLVSVERRGDQKACIYKNAAGGPKAEALGAEILAASGRLANVEGLNLDAVGVHADPQHGIVVDDFLQTEAPRIFAVGDVLLRHNYAHSAEREAEVVFENAILRRRRKISYDTLPRATFIDPEVAAVGLTAAQAAAEGRPHRVIRVEYADSDRAWIDGRTVGFAKVVVTPSGKVLGATIVGEESSLVIQELALAIGSGISLARVAEAVPIYPTYAGIVKRAADQFQASRFERGFLRSAIRLFYGFEPRSATASEPVEAAVVGHSHDHGH
ncbi:MAG: FAD-dependent oxidoreductase [Paludisphaera borealis]|uniref:dihydrolipoyl dehydrogenase family protein n=1 Tax=Paludisphaera borealis TaxID=1387353 RepID=UPI00284593F2|nr:FAD-dependent oxidoreductase [Paludisphaera borealis]MDR3620793.1 FAD-dependent oxidoreductase [Paludisphaera borealis]